MPTSFNSPDLPSFFFFFFDKLVMRHLQLMHISRNYFCRVSSMTCPWDMTCSEMHRSIKLNLSRTMQIMTNSIIPHYALHANLPNSRKSEGLAVLLKGTLSEWMMVKEHPQSPSSSNPSCGHLCPKTTELSMSFLRQNKLKICPLTKNREKWFLVLDFNGSTSLERHFYHKFHHKLFLFLLVC